MNSIAIIAFACALAAGLLAAIINKKDIKSKTVSCLQWLMAVTSVVLCGIEFWKYAAEMDFLKFLISLISPFIITFLCMAIGYGCLYPKKVYLFASQNDDKPGDRFSGYLASVCLWLSLAAGITLSWVARENSVMETCIMGIGRAIPIYVALILIAICCFAILYAFSKKFREWAD